MKDWESFIDREIERRDHRHGFLWAIALSSIAALCYVGNWLVWRLPEVTFLMAVSCVGVGAFLFLTGASKVTARLLHTVQPTQLYRTRAIESDLILVRVLAARGITPSFRWSSLPQLIAAIVVCGALVLTSDLVPSPYHYLTYAGIGAVGIYVVLNVVVGYLLRPRTVASVVAAYVHSEIGAAYSILSSDKGFVENAVTEIRMVASQSKIGRGVLAISEWGQRTSASPPPLSGAAAQIAKGISFGIINTFKIIGAAVWLSFHVAPLVALSLPVLAPLLRDYETRLPTAVVGAAFIAAVLLAFCVWDIVSYLYVNRSRALIEQLRFLAFSAEDDPKMLMAYYVLIETLTKAGLHLETNLHSLSQSIRLAEIANASRPTSVPLSNVPPPQAFVPPETA